MTMRGQVARWKAANCQRVGDHLGAAAQYKRLVELEGETPFEVSMIATCLAAGGEEDAALRAAERALALDPKAYLALETAARVHVKRGEHAVAREYVEQALEALDRERLDAGALRALRVFSLMGWVASRLPWLGRRVNRENVRKMNDPDSFFDGFREWAHRYLQWHTSQGEGSGGDCGGDGAI